MHREGTDGGEQREDSRTRLDSGGTAGLRRRVSDVHVTRIYICRDFTLVPSKHFDVAICVGAVMGSVALTSGGRDVVVRADSICFCCRIL